MRRDLRTSSQAQIAVTCDAAIPDGIEPSSGSITAILGAGPAGLTAAFELTRHGRAAVVFEAAPSVGGLARTVEYHGYLFDLGGHRFFTKTPEVEQIWRDVLGDDLLLRPRLSRILYQGRFFRYPLQPWDAVQNLGLVETLRCAASYLKALCFPTRPEEDFETYISNRFGRRLYERFFRAYTEKVWGLPCSEIRAEWAAQRIRGLDFGAILRNAFEFGAPRTRRRVLRTLTSEFLYPRRGPGMMWERMSARLREAGVAIHLRTPVTRLEWDGRAITTIRCGSVSRRVSHVISTIPLSALCFSLEPPPPEPVLSAARSLRYRDFVIVALIYKERELFRDNWIYIHDPNVRAGRIQNFKNWSPEMTPDSETTCLGVEYFCTEGDDVWGQKDNELVRFAAGECASLGIAPLERLVDGAVVRVRKAYPVYDARYADAVTELRKFLKTIRNLQVAGRNGMHRYNNQDHSMLSGILAARNVMGADYDLWSVNADDEYLEEGSVHNAENYAIRAV
jgi:protoporphyrinogen oxidase